MLRAARFRARTPRIRLERLILRVCMSSPFSKRTKEAPPIPRRPLHQRPGVGDESRRVGLLAVPRTNFRSVSANPVGLNQEVPIRFARAMLGRPKLSGPAQHCERLG